jgi:hypothetical protein
MKKEVLSNNTWNFVVENQPPFLLRIEVQNHNQPYMPVRMLRYLNDILLAYPKLSARQYLVYIGKAPLDIADGLDLPQFSYRYAVIDIHRVDGGFLLRQDSPDAWVLAVLCALRNRDAKGIVHEILVRLVERLHDQPPQLREYVSILEILAGNRDLQVRQVPDKKLPAISHSGWLAVLRGYASGSFSIGSCLNISEELNMLTIDFEALPTYQMGMKRGIEKGIEKGAHTQAVVIAKNLSEQGMELAWVAFVTGLLPAEIEKLQSERLKP